MNSLIFASVLAATLVAGQDPSWMTINMTAPLILDDSDYFWSQAKGVYVGTPPQPVDLTVDLTGDLLAVYSNECAWCSGTTFFDPTESSTFHFWNKAWSPGSALFNGTYVNDTVSFGGAVTDDQSSFVLIDQMSTNFSLHMRNGHLGVYVSDNKTTWSNNIFSRLWQEKKLLNPVVGLRYDPLKPTLTIGALDPADYEGTINWVQWEDAKPDWDFYNVIKIDGFKGYNGSSIPFATNMLAALNNFGSSIVVPNVDLYINNPGYMGPGLTVDLQGRGFGYRCNDTSKPDPYVALDVTINGVDYQIDSKNNMIRPHNIFAAPGDCSVSLMNRTLGAADPNVVLGLPFLRSVYLAYRFPTDDCPGYYGFAFPSGANRTQAQISQKPASTPTKSAQCLALTAPTSTPRPAVTTLKETLSSKTQFQVYGEDGQVALLGIDDLPKMVLNMSLVD